MNIYKTCVIETFIELTTNLNLTKQRITISTERTTDINKSLSEHPWIKFKGHFLVCKHA